MQYFKATQTRGTESEHRNIIIVLTNSVSEVLPVLLHSISFLLSEELHKLKL